MADTLYTISSEDLTVQIRSKGAELRSVVSGGTEYLWQPDPAYWTGQAPNLFPYIARLTDGCYRLGDQVYKMDQHGFARKSEFAVTEAGADHISFRLVDSADTLVTYPRHFGLDIIYRLEGKRIDITYRVENRDDQALYFGIGGHPGFCVPLDEGVAFEDYYLEFERDCQPLRVNFSEDCFVQGDPTVYPLENNRVMKLHHDMFDEDAIILSDMADCVTLKSDRGSRGVRVSYPEMSYLGIWHKPHTDAPYVCIEPWTSLPSRKGIVEDLTTQPGLIRLEPGKVYSNIWSIEIF